ncbi:MAG: long-chain-acyl-CoA synthetase [Dehalococcoidia bacterium]
MTADSQPKKGYVIPADEFERQMDYINTMEPYPPKVFYQRFVEVIRKAKQDGGMSWGVMHEQAAAKYPDRIAVKWDDKDDPVGLSQVVVPHVKYRAFNEGANRYANYFLERGFKKGDIICLLLANRVELLQLHVAAAKIGAISSMLNTGWRGRTLAYALKLNSATAIIVGEEHLDLFKEAGPEIEGMQGVHIFYVADRGAVPAPKGMVDLKEATTEVPTANPPTTPKVGINDPCHLVFTSGTTGGMPKAAFVMHKTLVENAHAAQMTIDLQKNDTIYIPLPFFHSTALGGGWPPAVLAGAAVALRRKFSATHFWNDTRKFRATKFWYVGEMCRYLMNQPLRPDDAANPVECMVGNGLRPEIWKAFKQRFDILVVNESYGASEMPSGFLNQYNFDCTVGRAAKINAVVKYDIDEDKPILNRDGFMEKCDYGDVGLLIIEVSESEPLMGYTSKEETEKKLLRDVFVKGDCWFNTGDLMRNIGFGHRQFVDRLGDTYRWHGENVSTTEVESVLDSFPQIYMSAVYGINIPGTEGRAGMATIMLLNTKPEEFDFRGLAEILKKELADFAVPRFIRIKDELEQTPSMKFKKGQLKQESYDIEKISDPVYVLLPGAAEYIPLTAAIRKQIDEGTYKL